MYKISSLFPVAIPRLIARPASGLIPLPVMDKPEFYPRTEQFQRDTGGQKRPLLPKQVWAIRARLELADYLRDLALIDVAIDSRLRGCDLVTLAVTDLAATLSLPLTFGCKPPPKPGLDL